MVDPDTPERDLDRIEEYLVSGTPEEPLFEAGDPGRGLYIIQEGRFQLVAPVDGDEVTVAELGPGDFFGERALFDDAPCEVTARPQTDYKVVLLDRDAFGRVVAEDPAIGMSLTAWLARRLQEQRVELARARRPAAGEAARSGSRADAGASAAAPASREAEAGEPMPDDAGAGEGARGPRLRHPDSGSAFDLPEEDEILIGRPDPDSGIAPDLDFGDLDEGRTLSRRHARILRRDDGFWLEDLGAANGTFVNGERIAAQSPVELGDGDEIRFGLVDTVFELD